METVKVSFNGPRADLRLNRPDVLNAVDLSVFDGLSEAADAIAARSDEIRVVVVSGEGRAFSAGIDVSALGDVAGDTATMIARAQAGYRKIAALEMPTVAKVHGYALGAGLQLALACDLRVVAVDAKLGLFEANYGFIPDLIGSTRLPQLVGVGWAKKMIWLAESVTGEEAASIGLAEWVVPSDELDKTTDEIADRLIAAPFTAVREAKKLIDASTTLSVAEGMDAEARAQTACMTAPDFGENLMAGLQRMTQRVKGAG